jgi:sarcosine oxidase subunit alpha
MPRLPDPRFAPDCTILVDGNAVLARAGESVTSALLAAGTPLIGRSAKYHRPRGPFCLAASCASCLVRVDGVPNVRACETPCREGLRVETQNAVGGAAHDLLGAIDRLAPNGIDHHRVGTWSQVVSHLTVNASRQLAGLGQLPEALQQPWPRAAEERRDALVVGAGPAGLGAAAALAGAGVRVLVVERERVIGGRLRCRLDLPGDPTLGWAADVADAVRRGGGEIATGATIVGLWRHGDDLLAAVVERGAPLDSGPPRGPALGASGTGRMRVVRAGRVVLATGTWAQPPVFESNDLPGIHGARGLAVALAEDGVVPGARAAVLGEGAEADAVGARLAGAGMAVERIDGIVLRARGRHRLAALELQDGRRVECDTLAVATPRLPATELAREAGAPLVLDATGTYRVVPDERGAVAPDAFAAGEITGPCSAAEAAEAGRRAGEGAARG